MGDLLLQNAVRPVFDPEAQTRRELTADGRISECGTGKYGVQGEGIVVREKKSAE